MSDSEDPVPAFRTMTGDPSADRSDLSPSEELLRLPGPLDAYPAASLAGTTVGHFRVIAPIGRGGMGVVYRAEDETLRREVALKVLPPSYAGDAERRRRLLREARSTAAVNHPNIATIYEVGETDGRIYIAMELVRGRNLGQVLSAGRLPPEEAVGIARQVLRGIQKAHEAGLVHRDLKPDNVMVTSDGLAKVLDFGLAKQRALDVMVGDAETVTHVSADGRLVGTPVYMSPEQARGVEIDQRSDLFSFGVVLYEMLTERRPFSGATTADLLTAILRDTPTPPSKLCPEVPHALSQIVERCLAKKPEDRYPDCASLLREIDQVFPAGQGSSASSSGASSGAKRAMPARGTDPERDRPAFAWSTWKVSLAAGVAALLGVGAAVRPWRTPPPPPPPVALTALAPRPTALTDLPLPSSQHPAAIAAYTEALQAQRDGNWGQSEASLRRAITIDPLMTAAHLRLAIVIDMPPSSNVEARESYNRAVWGRASLTERDQVLLRALEPVYGRDPPETSLAVQRLREATERYPLDAELFFVLSILESKDLEESLRAARRASELDPQYADAWQTMGERLSSLDRIEESLQAFDRCAAISPGTADCHGSRAVQLSALGRCAEAEESARRAITSGPKASPGWYELRATALHAMGRPLETVLEAFTQKWAQIPAERVRPIELYDRARLDIEAGRFDLAEAHAREGDRLIRSDPSAMVHAQYTDLLMYIYNETGRSREAVKLADDYLKRKDVWVGASAVRPLSMLMLRTMLHAGALSKDAFTHARTEWLAQGPKVGDADPGRLWLSAYTGALEQREEAEEALAAFAALPQGALSPRLIRRFSARIGQTYLLAGRVDEALPYLRPEIRPCRAPGENPPYYPLGQALEQKGDKEGACSAYTAVVDRWGDGKPRSVTADKAKARIRALGCAERKAGAVSAPPWLGNRAPT
jgi:eukaryotic-like serine/threonine-protein kinase